MPKEIKMPSSKTTKKETPTAPAKEVKAPKGVKVKNITAKTLNLQNGQIKAGEEGYATDAELSTLHLYLEKA